MIKKVINLDAYRKVLVASITVDTTTRRKSSILVVSHCVRTQLAENSTVFPSKHKNSVRKFCNAGSSKAFITVTCLPITLSVGVAGEERNARQVSHRYCSLETVRSPSSEQNAVQ